MMHNFKNADRTTRLLAAGLGFGALVMGLLLALLGRTGNPALLFIILSVIVALALGLFFVAVTKRNQQGEKAKHGGKAKREYTDIYELIDRLVTDIDGEEAAYLLRKLDAIDRAEVSESLETVLDQRETMRQSR